MSGVERLKDLLRRGSHKIAGNAFLLTTNPDQPVAPTNMDAASFLDMHQLRREVIMAGQALDAARNGMGANFGLRSADDTNRWNRLQREFWQDIVTIQSLHHDKFQEIDSAGASSLYEVAIAHAIELGSELVARRNIRQQSSLAKKNNLDTSMRPYLNLLDFHYAQALSIRIGRASFPDFVNPDPKLTPSLYCFLVDGVLVMTNNKGDEIVQNNLEPPKEAYPNFIKSVLWTFPKKIQSLLILDPELVEQAYRSACPPLNEMGQTASLAIRGMQETRARMFDLVLNPHSKQFPEAKQILQNYLAGADRLTTIFALNVLGLNRTSNIRRLYLEARNLLSKGIETDFFSLLAGAALKYAEEALSVVSIPTEDDMELIADLDKPLDPSIKVPTLEQLGTMVSAIFQKSSQRIYEINPSEIAWQVLYPADAITVRFNKEKPKVFDVTLGYKDDRGEITNVEYGFDIVKGLMRWQYFADPQWPENERIACFRSLLFCATSSMLTVIQGQVEGKYKSKQVSALLPIATPSSLARKERFQDPVYQLRKEVKTEQKQANAQVPIQENVPVEDLLQSAAIKNTIVIPQDSELSKLMTSLSVEHQMVVRAALKEFNELGGKPKRLDHSGLDGRPRWSLRIPCNVPKGIRVVLTQSKFVSGSRHFEIDYIAYRRDAYRHSLRE